MSAGTPSAPTAAQILAGYVADLEAALTADRLAAYRPAGGDDLAMVTTYFWNVALCRELYPCLSALEVSMRNGIHDALTAHTGHADWYDHVPLLQREHDKLAIAKASILRAHKPLVPGRVVAELDFSFWTSLLSAGAGPAGYGATLWSPNNAALVRRAFPHLPAPNQNRGFVHRRFNTLRLLRNRVFHYEPVWRGLTVQSGQSFALAGLHADIVDAIGWVSPRLRATLGDPAFDRFPRALRNGYAAVEADIKQHLGIP
jgi:hypothetical protein